LVNGRGATLTALRKAFEAQTKTKNGNAFYRDWVSASQTAVNKQLLSGTGKYALNDTAFWGINTDPSGNVGYLALTAMKDFTRKEKIDDDIEAVDTLLDTVFSACTGCKAIIVDLSQNRGGDDRVALAIAARFTDEARTAYTKQAWSKSAAADVQTLRLTPSAKPRWLGNVILVTDSVTVSAAEVLTLAMRTLPKVKHVGQTTRGALSDALEKSLPNGWRFTLSNEIYKSASGEVFEARGIAPSEPAPVFDADDFFSGQAKFLAVVVTKARLP
jgi:carboxyl-terminal processing protease